jgi:pyridoxine 5-phosphate synthase
VTNLSINVNKIALIRNSRGRNFPDLETFAIRCLELGASGITVHPRPDQRHARNDDLAVLAAACRSFERELNVEGYPSAAFLALMEELKPHQCTLVPDTPQQLTSDHGWDLKKDSAILTTAIKRLKNSGIRTSIFIDHDSAHIREAKVLGAERVELSTGPYARQLSPSHCSDIHKGYVEAVRAANAVGLGVNAGHDLNLENLSEFLRIPNILEVSIGHAFIVDCIYFGIDNAMRRYLQLVASTS